MKNKEAKNEEAKKPRMKNHKKPRMKKPRRTPRTPTPHKNNFKYFTIFNTSLFYKPFSTTSKSI